MRIFLIALAVVYWAGASLATSIVLKPAKCPVAADLAPLTAGDAAALDLNQWRKIGDDVTPLVDIALAEMPQTGEVFARLRADPNTGRTLSPAFNACDD